MMLKFLKENWFNLAIEVLFLASLYLIGLWFAIPLPITIAAMVVSSVVLITYWFSQSREVEALSVESKQSKFFKSPFFISFATTFLTMYKTSNNIQECLKQAVIVGLLAYFATLPKKRK